MRKHLTILLAIIFIHSALSQDTDSLKYSLDLKENQEKADVSLKISKAYWHSNRDSAVSYASKALQLSKNVSYNRGIAEAYRYIGVSNMFGGEPEISERYLDSAL